MSGEPTAGERTEPTDDETVTRRRALAAGGAAALAGLAGCTALDVVTGDERAARADSDARVTTLHPPIRSSDAF